MQIKAENTLKDAIIEITGIEFDLNMIGFNNH